MRLNLVEDVELSAALLHEHLDRLISSVDCSVMQWRDAVLVDKITIFSVGFRLKFLFKPKTLFGV